ncbi:MAG: ABC transporter substrate-binding protein [Lachnospiraceae bacterium]|nr:ABC transporter substrate-binding protein [Lachnospiraceae bacterium]
MYKKILSLCLILCLSLSMLTGCGSKDSASTINLGCMKGPTAIGMIKLISDADAGETAYSYAHTIAGTADEISTGLINGTLDIAAVPCNLASVLYNKTEGEIVTVAINTLGVLYIVESGDKIHSVNDLKGTTIYSTGQGTTPEYTLRYLLNSAGIDPDKDVTIEYKSEATEVVAALTQNPEAVAMLPQPYVTVATNNNPDLRIALNVAKEWEKLAGTGGTVVTGVLVARKSFLKDNPKVLKSFLEEYKASAEYANSNIEETAALLESYDVFKAAIAKKAIPYCSVTYIDGEYMKTLALSYLNVLYEQNPKAVGGKAPTEGMFYIEK